MTLSSWLCITLFLFVLWMTDSALLGFMTAWILYGALRALTRLGQAIQSRGGV